MEPFSFGCWKMINSHAVVALQRVDRGKGVFRDRNGGCTAASGDANKVEQWCREIKLIGVFILTFLENFVNYEEAFIWF